MRNYQRKKNNPYRLPDNLYRQILYIVKDYDRIKSEWENILHESPTNDGQPKGAGVSDPTTNKAIRRERLLVKLEAVDQGLLSIPEEYRRGVLRHIKYGAMYPNTAHLNTWKKWQAKFLYNIAEKLGET